MKKGVRSQSMASTVFSRIKNLGRKVKNTAGSVVGGSSGKGSMFGAAWAGGASSVTHKHKDGGASGKAGSRSVSIAGGDVQHDAVAAFRPTADETVAVVNVTGVRRQSVDGRRSSTDGGHRRASHLDNNHSNHGHNSVDGRRSVQARRVSISEHSEHHTAEHGHSTDGRSHHYSSSEQHHQQSSTHGTRGSKGPVGEAALRGGEVWESGWGSGLKRRRHMLGLQVHYGMVQFGQGDTIADSNIQPGSRRTSRDAAGSRRVSTDSAGSRRSSGDAAGSRRTSIEAAGGRRVSSEASGSRPSSRDGGGATEQLHVAGAGSFNGRQFLRRSSSSGCSSVASFKRKQDAAVAFAAAAAAEAVLPHHAFPELVDSSSDEEGWFGGGKARKDRTGKKSWPEGSDPALSAAQENTGMPEQQRKRTSGSGSRPTSSRPTSSSVAGVDDAPFSWQEFLSTLAAIDYPDVIRQQKQEAFLEQQQQRQGSGGFKGAELGPIAEGVENGSNSACNALNPSPTVNIFSHSMGADGAGAATLSHGMAAVAAAAVAAGPAEAVAAGSRPVTPSGGGLVPKPPASPSPLAGHQNVRSHQQLSLEVLDSELQSLGLQTAAAEPETPCVLVHGQSSSGAVSAAAGAKAGSGESSLIWPGLVDRSPQSSPRPAGVRAQPGILITPREGEPGRDSSNSGSLSHRGPPPKERRVTLFTESMKKKGEGPAAAEPSSPRVFRYNPTSQPSQPSALKGGSSYVPDLDDVLEMSGAPNSARPAGGNGLPAAAATPAVPAAGPQELLLSTAASEAADVLLLEGLVGTSVEPSITAKAIKRRKQAGVVS